MRAAGAVDSGGEEIAVTVDYTEKLARALHVIGLMNVQYAIQNGKVYVLEVNPRASRTVPYVSKATGVPLPKIAVAADARPEAEGSGEPDGRADRGRAAGEDKVCVKSPVFPFGKFPGVDPALGPEMRSTGEVMGVGDNFGEAFDKGAEERRGGRAENRGGVFFSVNDRHKREAVGDRAAAGGDGVRTGGDARHGVGAEVGRTEGKEPYSR